MQLLILQVLVFLMPIVFGHNIGQPLKINPNLEMTGDLRALFDNGPKPFLDKIIGGSEARYGDIPWQASIKVHGEHGCGASILNELWLLTAAHCFMYVPNKMLSVTVGEHYLAHRDKDEFSFKVKNIYRHPLYNATTYDYDFALIKIAPSPDGSGIQFSKFVQPINLPAPTASLKDGDKLLISGWGHVKYGDTRNHHVLKKAVIPYVNRDKCNKSYLRRITDRMFCAGFKEGGTDTCQNDSGGPVAYKSKDKYVLFGVVSWATGCAMPHYYGVNANVPAVLEWIETILAGSG